jgi:hypothetical protein
MSKEDKRSLIYAGCFLAVFLTAIVSIGISAMRKYDRRNAQFENTCAPLILTSVFVSIDKVFVVCAPKYVSKPEDFIVREVR